MPGSISVYTAIRGALDCWKEEVFRSETEGPTKNAGTSCSAASTDITEAKRLKKLTGEGRKRKREREQPSKRTDKSKSLAFSH